MSALQNNITEKFLAEIEETKLFEPNAVQQLRVLLTGGGKLKADDFVKVFTGPLDGEVK